MAKLVSSSHIRAEIISTHGSDRAIADAAWVSTAKGTGRSDDDAYKLLNYLIDHGHTTPLEFAGATIRLHAPINILSQFLRHRMLSAVMSSTRYGVCGWELLETCDHALDTVMLKYTEFLEQEYNDRPKSRRTNEQLLKCAPMWLFSECVISININSLANMLNKRLNIHAQLEARILAQSILDELKKTCFCPHIMTRLEKKGFKI